MTLVQKPNPPLTAAIVAFLVKSIIPTGPIHHLGDVLLTVSLIIWSYLEVTEGINWFRRSLGVVVLIANIITIYKRFN